MFLWKTLTNTAYHTSPHAMWVALQNWFTEYSHISRSAVYSPGAGKAFSWLCSLSYGRETLMIFLWKQSTFSPFRVLFSLFSTLFPFQSSVAFSGHSDTYLPSSPCTPISSQHMCTVTSVCFHTFCIEPWCCSSPGKTFSSFELVSPHLRQGWGESSNCYVSPCARHWLRCFTYLSLVMTIQISGGSCCHHAHFAVRKRKESHRNSVWIQAVWP